MLSSPKQFIEMHRMQVDAINCLGHAMIAAAEKLSELNLSTGRKAIDKATSAAQSMASSGDPQGALAGGGADVQPSIEQLMAYSRNLIAIGNGVQAEFERVFEVQLAEGNRHVSALVDFAARKLTHSRRNGA